MAVAAGLFLAVTVELMGQARRSEARKACAMNLRTVGNGFESYAADNNGELPSLPMPSNRNWLYGDAATGAKDNSANLLPLVTGNYVPVMMMFCKGAGLPSGPVNPGHNEMPAIGYSYRNLWGPERPMWDHARETIVLADKNPMFAPGVRQGTQTRNSANHDGHGQYLLRADTSVSWETTPFAGPAMDNIWTIGAGKGQLLNYTGTEVPASLSDVFVCP